MVKIIKRTLKLFHAWPPQLKPTVDKHYFSSLSPGLAFEKKNAFFLNSPNLNFILFATYVT